jgi:SAM-dependent methyltransferase
VLSLQQPSIDRAGEVVAGVLACADCFARYPVHAGIADFLGPPRPPTPAQLANELPLTAWVYERGWRPFALTLLSGEPFPYRRELPLVVGLVEPRRGGLYLDVACSNGLYARALARALRGGNLANARAPGHVAAVDHSLPMLEQARRYALDAGLRVSYLRAKAQALPIAPCAAAGVVIGGSLNEISGLDACLAEVRRALADNGRYLAMTLARAATPGGRAFQRLVDVGGIEFWTPGELEVAFARHGLRTVAAWKYGLVMFHLALPE